MAGKDPAAFRRAVAFHRRGNQYRWASALGCAQVVGRREDGLTRRLAHRMALSVDQIENLARAAVTYRALRRHVGAQGSPAIRELHHIRETLTPSHFSTLGDLWRRFEFGADEAFAALQTAADEGASVKALAQFVQAEHTADPPERAWGTWDFAEEELGAPQGFGDWLPDGRQVGQAGRDDGK